MPKRIRKYNGTGYNFAEMRSIALGAARARLKRAGIDPMEATADGALNALDDALREAPGLVAAQWYANATDNQLTLFVREWRKWQRQQKERDDWMRRYGHKYLEKASGIDAS